VEVERDSTGEMKNGRETHPGWLPKPPLVLAVLLLVFLGLFRPPGACSAFTISCARPGMILGGQLGGFIKHCAQHSRASMGLSDFV